MKVFISHAQTDHAFAEGVAKVLEAAGHEVWTGDEVLPGDNFASAVGDALAKADAVVAVISPEALRSRYVQREWEFALGRPNLKNFVPIEVKRTVDRPWIFDRLNVLTSSDPKAAGREVLKRMGSSTSRSALRG